MNKLMENLELINSKTDMKEYVAELESQGISYCLNKFTKKFAEGRDMMLLEVDELNFEGVKLNAKYYCDMEFDTYHYSIEKDMKIMHDHYLSLINEDDSINETEKQKRIGEMVNSEKYKADQDAIQDKIANRIITKFHDYTIVGGLFFFNPSDREKLMKILTNQFGEAVKFDGHDLWSSYTNRIEIGPTIFTFMTK